MSGSIYSVSYIDIFSTTGPVVTQSDITRMSCENKCNGDPKCNAFAFKPVFTVTCTQDTPTGSDGTLDISKCKRKNDSTTDDPNAYGECFILGSGPEVNGRKIQPVYLKNMCSNYAEICSSIWNNQLTTFLVIFAILLSLNVILYNKCKEISKQYYYKKML